MSFDEATGVARRAGGVVALVRLSPPAPERPLLVLGPSLGTAVRPLWRACADVLADRFEIIGWELPGHGYGSPTKDGFRVPDLARWIVAGIDAVSSRPEFAYAGDSIGGAVGLALLIDHGPRVQSATIACTGAKIGTPELWAERAALVRADGTAAVVEGSRARWFAPGFTERHPGAAEALLDDLHTVDSESYALTCEALAAFDVRDRLGEISRPLSVVAGADDVATPLADAEQIVAGVSQARLHVLDGVAHLAPFEAPVRVAELITATVVRTGQWPHPERAGTPL